MDEEIPKHRKRGKKKKYKIVYEQKIKGSFEFMHTHQRKYETLKAAEQSLENFNNGGGGWPNNKNYTARIEEL
jgi:hypothetical protein